MAQTQPVPAKYDSYWLTATTTNRPMFSALQQDTSVDVAIVGGGITGMTIAYLLKRSGRRVAVLEKNTLASGTTGGTTGKVTAQHGLLYRELVQRHGKRTALAYAEANKMALDNLNILVKTERINCGWQQADNYVFTTDQNRAVEFRQEAETAASLGLPASFTKQLSLPFKVAAAVKFSKQAYMNAAAFTLGLAERIEGQGSHVYEHSNVVDIEDGEPATVSTDDATVTAKQVVLATKIPPGPLLARFSYGLLEYPQTSHIVAGAYDGDLQDMYISPDKNHFSILPVRQNGEQLLFIGGRNYIPGLGSAQKSYRQLSDYAQKHFGVRDIRYRWKEMDYIAYDELPLIGKLYPWSKHLYTATGFKKWGLTTSMVAAMILHDQIVGAKNVWSKFFASDRLSPIAAIPRAAVDYLAS